MLNAVAQVFIVLGALIFGSAGIGLITLRDAFARSSAIATAAGLGVSLILVGVFLLNPSWPNAIKLVIAVVLQLSTSAIGSMAIVRAAYQTGSHLDLVSPDADELAREADQGGRQAS